MKEPIRLYRPHDIDLMIMYLSDEYKLLAEMKKCLIAYANGELYTPPVFDFSKDMEIAKRLSVADDKDAKYIRPKYKVFIRLSPNKADEAAAIDILKQIRRGYRCAFIKMLFRNNSISLPLMSCIEDNGFLTKKTSFEDALKARNVVIEEVKEEIKEDIQKPETKDPVPKIERKEEVQPEEDYMFDESALPAPIDDGEESDEDIFGFMNGLGK